MRYQCHARQIGVIAALLVAVTIGTRGARAQSGDPAAGADVAPAAPSEPREPGGVVVPVAPSAPRRVASPATAASPLKGVIKELRSGPLLVHGNYCGIGNRPGAAPIDALDAACMRHDACTKTGKLPGCACNERLRLEAAAVAQDPRARPEEQVAAAATASAMAVLVCKSGGRLEVPILPAPR